MFGQPIGPSFEFECPTYTEAVNRLLYVVEQSEPFVLFTGQPGTGRSTLLRSVQAECQRFGHSAILINVAALDENAFLWHLCGALSIVPGPMQSRCELMAAVRDELNGRALCNYRTVIILDDLDRAVEELTGSVQFLTAINQQANGCVSVIAGCDEQMPSQLTSLSALRVELPTLTDDEAKHFAAQYFKSLNAHNDRINNDAMDTLISFGQGLPVRLRRLCEIASVALATDPLLQLDTETLNQLTGETLLCRASQEAPTRRAV